MAVTSILSYITKAPTCFGAPALSSGSFGIVFVKVRIYIYIYNAFAKVKKIYNILCLLKLKKYINI
jgi:hypothetical protein